MFPGARCPPQAGFQMQNASVASGMQRLSQTQANTSHPQAQPSYAAPRPSQMTILQRPALTLPPQAQPQTQPQDLRIQAIYQYHAFLVRTIAEFTTSHSQLRTRYELLLPILPAHPTVNARPDARTLHRNFTYNPASTQGLTSFGELLQSLTTSTDAAWASITHGNIEAAEACLRHATGYVRSAQACLRWLEGLLYRVEQAVAPLQHPAVVQPTARLRSVARAIPTNCLRSAIRRAAGPQLEHSSAQAQNNAAELPNAGDHIRVRDARRDSATGREPANRREIVTRPQPNRIEPQPAPAPASFPEPATQEAVVADWNDVTSQRRGRSFPAPVVSPNEFVEERWDGFDDVLKMIER